MKKIIFALSLLAAACGAQAQNVTADSGARADAQVPVTVSPVFNGAVTPEKQEIVNKIRDNRASTAPGVYGSVGGCMGLEGASGSIAVANGSKTWLAEGPGCMGLQLGVFIGSLTIGPNGEIDRKTANQIEAQCDFPQFKGALSRMVFSLNGQPWNCGGAQAAAPTRAPVALIAPTPAAPADPYIARSGRQYPSVR